MVGTEWIITGNRVALVVKRGSHKWVHLCLCNKSHEAMLFEATKNLKSPDGSIDEPLMVINWPSSVRASKEVNILFIVDVISSLVILSKGLLPCIFRITKVAGLNLFITLFEGKAGSGGELFKGKAGIGGETVVENRPRPFPNRLKSSDSFAMFCFNTDCCLEF